MPVSDEPDDIPAAADTLCARCEKPRHLCICAAVAPIENRVALIILRHPQEQDRVLGTARLTVLQLTNAVLRTGLSWPNLATLTGRASDPRRWGILYLGTAKTAEPLPPRLLTVVDKAAGRRPTRDDALAALEGIILLDGNWQQAKALWWRNAWMLKCQRLVLQPPRPSYYGALRREPRRDSVSTIEAAAYALSALEHDEALPARILAPFRLLLDKARAHGAGPRAQDRRRQVRRRPRR